MFQFAHPILVQERQATLLREAANERLARIGRTHPAAHRRHRSFRGRLGPIVTTRLGRLLPAGR